eukprot:gene7785-7983_t
MEAAREYLHSQPQAAGPIAGLLNFLSNNAFGANRGGLHLGSFYRQWLQYTNQWGQQRNLPTQQAARAAVAAAPGVVSDLAVLMLVSEHRVQQLANQYPQVLAMPAAEVAQRLLLLKQLLPDCDVARMVELQPRWGQVAGSCEPQQLCKVIKPRLEVLSSGLPGANIADMMQEDPALLFEELESGLPKLHDLWPGLDASTLAASDPAELALALRALSDQGPPRRY